MLEVWSLKCLFSNSTYLATTWRDSLRDAAFEVADSCGSTKLRALTEATIAAIVKNFIEILNLIIYIINTFYIFY